MAAGAVKFGASAFPIGIDADKAATQFNMGKERVGGTDLHSALDVGREALLIAPCERACDHEVPGN